MSLWRMWWWVCHMPGSWPLLLLLPLVSGRGSVSGRALDVNWAVRHGSSQPCPAPAASHQALPGLCLTAWPCPGCLPRLGLVNTISGPDTNLSRSQPTRFQATSGLWYKKGWQRPLCQDFCLEICWNHSYISALAEKNCTYIGLILFSLLLWRDKKSPDLHWAVVWTLSEVASQHLRRLRSRKPGRGRGELCLPRDCGDRAGVTQG